jgi:hypothetical protein
MGLGQRPALLGRDLPAVLGFVQLRSNLQIVSMMSVKGKSRFSKKAFWNWC